MRHGTIPFALFACALAAPSRALWPFQQKRFTQEAFIDAGSLGVDGKDFGRVVALGDWNGDQKLDLITLDESQKIVTVYEWDKDAYQYKAMPGLETPQRKILNIVPGDFDHDGKLDLLIMSEDTTDGGWWGRKDVNTYMTVHFGAPQGGFRDDISTIGSASEAQPLIYDADGSLRPSLLGYSPSEDGKTSHPRLWQNSGSGFTQHSPRLSPSEQMCQFASPHSSAYIDIDGDCLPDLVLHCVKAGSSQQYIQIWLNKGSSGYVLSKEYDLPRNAGPLSFADMDRDGTMDIVFPVCARHSASTGIGSECSINIAYNRQIPVCSGISSESADQGLSAESLKCRGWGELCVSDPNFSFAFEQGNEDFTTISLSTLFAFTGSEPDLLLNPPKTPKIQLPLRPGDYNVDGFPDLLFTISNSSAIHSGIFGGTGTQIRVLENVACKKGMVGCAENQKRGFKVKRGKGWEGLDQLTDVLGASWIDIDEDGSLDILAQRSGEQAQHKVTFIKNNLYNDAFFLKAQVLNGACDKVCQSSKTGKKYQPFGVSYSGATYKFTVLDTLGRRVAQQSAQLPQTGYHALNTPYSFIGLGRTNNYVERLTIGASLHPPNHITEIESIVPNSQILINPPYPVIEPDGSSPVKERSKEWRKELFLHPGDWVPWVGAAVVGTVLALIFVVVGLNEKEKKEDEKERQRALHAINFQAL